MKQQSLGLRLVEALAQQLKGELAVAEGNPICFTITFARLQT